MRCPRRRDSVWGWERGRPARPPPPPAHIDNSKPTGNTMAPRVLISDALSPAAVQIFKDRGVDVEFQPSLGKDKDKLAAIVGKFDGLALRSSTTVPSTILAGATHLKV